MYIGFMRYSFGNSYAWVCEDWQEMYEYCKDDIGIIIPEVEQEDYFSYTNDIINEDNYDEIEDSYLEKDTWISIQKASEYSLKQMKQC